MKLGRPLEYDREEVLEIAMHLFWHRGFERTSLKDILDATKISKSSFYYAFGGKDELYEECLNRYCDMQMEYLLTNLEQAATGRVFIESILKEIEATSRSKEPHKGCFLMNTASEFAGRDHIVFTLVSRATLQFVDVFQRAIKRGQEEGVISKQKAAGALAFYLISSIAGLRTMIKADAAPESIDKIVFVIESALD